MKLIEYGYWTYIRYTSYGYDEENYAETEYVKGKLDAITSYNNKSIIGAVIIKDGAYHSKWGAPPIVDLLKFHEPNAFTQFATAMAAPIRRNLDYTGVARKSFIIEKL